MIKAAPLIHSRTLYRDFNPKFLARPGDMTDGQALQIKKKILEATRSADSLQGIRWVVFRDGACCVAGIVCFLEQLASYCQVEEQDKEFFCDSKGRPVYAFIGAVIDGEDAGVPDFSYQTWWNWYIASVRPVWERQVVSTQFTDYETIVTADTSLPTYERHVIGTKTVYEASEKGDKDLFYQYLKRALRGQDVSYCSNITNFNDARQISYTAITTTDNIMRRLAETSSLAAATRPAQKKTAVSSNTLTSPMPKESYAKPSNQRHTLVYMGMLGLAALLAFILYCLVKR